MDLMSITVIHRTVKPGKAATRDTPAVGPVVDIIDANTPFEADDKEANELIALKAARKAAKDDPKPGRRVLPKAEVRAPSEKDAEALEKAAKEAEAKEKAKEEAKEKAAAAAKEKAAKAKSSAKSKSDSDDTSSMV